MQTAFIARKVPAERGGGAAYIHPSASPKPRGPLPPADSSIRNPQSAIARPALSYHFSLISSHFALAFSARLRHNRCLWSISDEAVTYRLAAY
jgi:hypothetical protein